MDSFRDIQSGLWYWQRSVLPEEALCHKLRFTRMLDEVEEAKASIETPQEFISEVVDIIISAIGVLNCLYADGLGLIEEKMTLMFKKYNPVENKRLRASGMRWDEAMGKQKEEWRLAH